MYELQTRDTVWADGLRLLPPFDRGESLEKIRACPLPRAGVADRRVSVAPEALDARRN
jgi:hypothetical protein